MPLTVQVGERTNAANSIQVAAGFVGDVERGWRQIRRGVPASDPALEAVLVGLVRVAVVPVLVVNGLEGHGLPQRVGGGDLAHGLLVQECGRGGR